MRTRGHLTIKIPLKYESNDLNLKVINKYQIRNRNSNYFNRVEN